MSTAEQLVTKSPPVSGMSGSPSVLNRVLRFMCSVRLGVALLVLLGIACVLGMLVMQQNVDGFDRYFLELTPSQRLVYGSLGLFDIYHSWYFNALLAVLSLNIVLASIERFPKSWKVVSDPPLTVPLRWLRDQPQAAELEFTGTQDEVVTRIKSAMKSAGWRKILEAEKNGKKYVMGQSGAWNRLGAYPVHVALLTIFLGGFLTAQMGSTGQVPLAPEAGATDLMSEVVADLDKASEVTKRLPFKLECVDIQQKLIKKEGSINAMNTIDWITRFRIIDDTGTHDASVQMNRPVDYRGYRFFQASFVPTGRARSITVNARSASGGAAQSVTIPRGGSMTLADGTELKFAEFRANFRIGPEDPNEDTSSYENPAAVLRVTPPGGTAETAYAFGPGMAGMPVATKPVGGYTYQLADFEKVGDKHILSVQRDPGATVVYVGFVLLVITLVAVFFFSYQRVWAAVDPTPDGALVTLGGNANRNLNAFDEKFKSFVNKLETTES